MASWWEIGIPVAGTLAGAVVGAGSQLLLRWAQSRHERFMRLHDDKRAVYARFALLTPRLGNILLDPKSRIGDLTPEEQLRDLTESIKLCYAQIRMLAPERVVTAASDLLDASLDEGLSREQLTAAEAAFEEAARQDLRVR